MTDTYAVEIDIDAPRERVWHALTTSRELERWFCEHADIDLAAKRFDFWGRHTPGNPSRSDGARTIVDVVEGERLVYDWRWRDADTRVTTTLSGGGPTTVRVTHESVAARRQPTEHQPRHLWSGALVHLRAYLETGRPGPRFDYSWPHVGEFRVEAGIGAPRQAVWAELVENGWQSPANPSVRPARNDGEDFSFDVGVVVGIRVVEVEAPSRYVLEWIDPRPTVVTYELAESGGATRVTIVHSGFAPDEDVQGMAEGFFSGLFEVAWRLETAGAWPPPATRLRSDLRQSHGDFGARVLASAV